MVSNRRLQHKAAGIEEFLRVAEALSKDVGRAIARLDPDDMRRLGIGVGDALRIQGKRATVCRAMPTHKDQRGRGCVQIDGVRYFESLKVIDFIANRDPDGVISDSVDRDAFPETDRCSNFGTGYSYWVTGDNAVVVEIDGEYCEFEAN